jgi:hypothetical protein
MLEKILSDIEKIEEVSSYNNSLLGFLISKKISNDIIPMDSELKSVVLTGEMMEYLQENNISMDFLGDA